MSKALYDGHGPPDDEFGADGDFYLDTLTYIMYGPKNSGAWPLTGKNLVGPAGTQGVDGAPGAQGPPGPAPSGTGVVTVTNGALNAPGAISLAGSLVSNVLPLANQRDEGVKRLSIMAGSLTHGTSTRRQVGSIVLDTSLFPSTIGGLTRKVRFLANVQKSNGATNVQAILYDADHDADVSTLTSTSNGVALAIN